VKTRTSKRRGTRHASADVRRAQILDAALRCFAEHGYRRTTMDGVVAASGLSKGSLYRFFRSKDEILAALFDAFDQQIGAELERGAASADALAALEGVGTTVLTALVGQRELMQAWMEFFGHRDLRHRFRTIYRRTRRRIRALVQAAIDHRQIGAVDPTAIAAGILGAVEGLLLQAMVDAAFDPRKHWPAVWSIMRRGLEAHTRADAGR
jgi:AcrR family transcriptional regulator